MARIIGDQKCLFKEPLLLDQPAANFTGEAYLQGERINLTLYDYLKHYWVVLFFYTADFTFV